MGRHFTYSSIPSYFSPNTIQIGVCTLGVVGIGVYPSPWVDMAMRVASTLF